VSPAHRTGLLAYAIVGILFGIVLVKGELVSWFRIQEMFRFQGFHMFGVFLLAIPVAMLSVQALKRAHARTREGEPVALAPKELGRGVRYVAGGLLFGFGWALAGACPGPMFALAGAGAGGGTMLVVIASAVAGAWLYGRFRHRLPH